MFYFNYNIFKHFKFIVFVNCTLKCSSKIALQLIYRQKNIPACLIFFYAYQKISVCLSFSVTLTLSLFFLLFLSHSLLLSLTPPSQPGVLHERWDSPLAASPDKQWCVVVDKQYHLIGCLKPYLGWTFIIMLHIVMLHTIMLHLSFHGLLQLHYLIIVNLTHILR